MIFNIRPMASKDLVAIEHIQMEAYAGYFLESAEVIAQRFHANPATAWVAELNDQVCAYLVGYLSKVGKINPLNAPFTPHAGSNCLYLHDLALSKSARGFGVSEKLIYAATEHASKSFSSALALLSVQNSKEFWKRFGFVEFTDIEFSQQKNLNTYLNGSESAFYMIKKL